MKAQWHEAEDQRQSRELRKTDHRHKRSVSRSDSAKRRAAYVQHASISTVYGIEDLQTTYSYTRADTSTSVASTTRTTPHSSTSLIWEV